MSSQVEAEIRQIPGAVERQLREMGSGYREIGRLLGSKSFNIAISNARGTSDHAATYLKYLLEIQAGIPVASIGPSVVSVYGAKLRLKDQLCVTLSQSGASRDLVLLQQAAALSGATTLAIVNDVASPVARDAELLAPIHAGTEIAVAATKSYVCSLVAIASIVGAMTDDTTLLTALARYVAGRSGPGLVARRGGAGPGALDLHAGARTWHDGCGGSGP
jgi:glucosamine--fructose-6-phosphate aminotransferase (isomerizing)